MMKRLLFPIVLAVVLCSCAKDDRLVVAETRAFVTYLDQNSYINDLPCDTLGGGVWRVLENPREGREDGEQAVSGSEVRFFYEGYEFNPSLNLDPSIGQRPAPFGTNRGWIINELGMNPVLWPVEPEVAKLGNGNLFKGLDRGITGAYEGDELLLLISSGSGYGEKDKGMVPKNTSVVFRISINNVR